MTPKVSIVLLLLCVIFHYTYPQVSKVGSCLKKIKPVANFDLSKFSGVWYEVRRYPLVYISGHCASINVSAKAIGKRIGISTTQLLPGKNKTSQENVEMFNQGNGVLRYKLTLGLGM